MLCRIYDNRTGDLKLIQHQSISVVTLKCERDTLRYNNRILPDIIHPEFCWESQILFEHELCCSDIICLFEFAALYNSFKLRKCCKFICFTFNLHRDFRGRLTVERLRNVVCAGCYRNRVEAFAPILNQSAEVSLLAGIRINQLSHYT